MGAEAGAVILHTPWGYVNPLRVPTGIDVVGASASRVTRERSFVPAPSAELTTSAAGNRLPTGVGRHTPVVGTHATYMTIERVSS